MTQDASRQRRESELRLVHDRLAEARRVWRFVLVGSTLLRGLTYLLIAFSVAIILDNLWALPQVVRMTMLAGFGLGGLYLLGVRVGQALFRPLTDEMVARHVERKYDHLDNRLINAVLLEQERFDDPVARNMADSQLDETAEVVRDCDMRSSTNRKPLWKWGKWAGALTVFVIIYAVAFSQHFQNALQRYSAPQKNIPPVTNTRLTVHPGDAECLQGESLVIEAHTEGVLPETATVHFSHQDGKTTRKEMPFEGSFFSYEFLNCQNDFSYHVSAGDATSRPYQVTVRTRPKINQFKLTYRYPDYTGLEDKSESSSTGNIRTLTGTTVDLRALVDREITDGQLTLTRLTGEEGADQNESRNIELKHPAPNVVTATFPVEYSARYKLNVIDVHGTPNEPTSRQIVALPDEPPSVKVLEPGKEVTAAPDEKVTLLAEALDDFCVRSMSLFIQQDDTEWEKHRSWSYEGQKVELREGAVLDLNDLNPQIGQTISYYFRATDGRPGRDESAGKSRVYDIVIVDKNIAQAKEDEQRKALRTLINRLIALQEGNLTATRKLQDWKKSGFGDIQADESAQQRYGVRARAVMNAEEKIYERARQAVKRYSGGQVADTVEGLATIASNEISLAVDKTRELTRVKTVEGIAPSAKSAAETEQQVIDRLRQLLKDPQKLLAERREKEKEEEKVAENEGPLMDEKKELQRMLKKIKQFKEDEKEVVELTKQLADKGVDEFTSDDEQKLEELTRRQLKWAEYFQEKANDLSDVPAQDFALGSMAKEHMEVYSEVQAAADALKKKAVEIATAAEESATAKAESIEENIEKWLGDSADNIAWKMEANEQELDIPLADLPEQLEDLMGELMAEEEELMEQAEDANANTLGSFDKGIGWDTMDGPIASMAAKGVTGNKLPNANNVGGRSGEGRTGKSSGQFVEETATGKGGRRTPTRKTPDPFESGMVKDTAPEPPTGATGGGKASGFGREGFQGQTPAAAKKLKRLARQQQQLIDKARRIAHGLEKRRYPTGQLPETINIMEQLKGELERGGYIPTAAQKRHVVLSNLREIKQLTQKEKRLRRDRSALLPEELRDEVSASLKENVPREYKDMVDNYFRALAESETE